MVETENDRDRGRHSEGRSEAPDKGSRGERGRPRVSARMVLLTVTVAAVFGAIAHLVHQAYLDTGDTFLRAAPFFATFSPKVSWWALGAVVVATVWVALAVLSPVARRVHLQPWFFGFSAAGWAYALGSLPQLYRDRPDRIAKVLVSKYEYLPFARSRTPAQHYADYLSYAADAPIHVKGHPPGITALFRVVDQVGIDTPPRLGAFVTVVWGIGVVFAVKLAHASTAHGRGVQPDLSPAGREVLMARSGLTFGLAAVSLPAVLWAGFSADAIFSTVAVVYAYLAVVGFQRRSPLLVLASGLAFAVGMNLTYGFASLGLVIVAVFLAIEPITNEGSSLSWWTRSYWHHRYWSAVLWWSLGVVVILGWAYAAGFNWFEGLELVRKFYWEGIAATRPSWYFVLFGNPAVALFALGPIVVSSWVAWLRGWRIRTGSAAVAVAGLLSMVAANLSLMSKAEVERIWLLFYLLIAQIVALVDWPRRLLFPLIWLLMLATVAVESYFFTSW